MSCASRKEKLAQKTALFARNFPWQLHKLVQHLSCPAVAFE
jgi:hypothetical protein